MYKHSLGSSDQAGLRLSRYLNERTEKFISKPSQENAFSGPKRSVGRGWQQWIIGLAIAQGVKHFPRKIYYAPYKNSRFWDDDQLAYNSEDHPVLLHGTDYLAYDAFMGIRGLQRCLREPSSPERTGEVWNQKNWYMGLKILFWDFKGRDGYAQVGYGSAY